MAKKVLLLFCGIFSFSQIVFAQTPAFENNPYGMAGHGHYWEEVKATGAKWARMWVGEGGAVWGEMQPVSLDSFYWDKLDSWVKEIDAAGLKMMLTIRTNGGPNCQWTDASYDSSVGASPNLFFWGASFPPLDYDDWYNFVFAIVQRYDGNHTDKNGDLLPEINYFETQAENDIPLYWYGSKEEYYDLFLPTFYRAVHDANPEAIVIGGSLTGESVGYAIADSMYRTGIEPAQIRDFVMDYFGLEDISWEEIENILNSDDGRRRIEFVNYSFKPQNGKVCYDKRGFHHYNNWKKMREMLVFLKNKMNQYNYSKPLWGTEVGRVDSRGMQNVPQAEQAGDYGKKMILSFVEGTEWLCYAPMTAIGNSWFLPLYKDAFSGPEPREARDTFAFIASKINENTKYHFHKELVRNGVHFYYFESDDLHQEFIAAWAPEGSAISAFLDIPDSANSLAVFDYLGNPVSAAWDDSLTYNFTELPVFIEWRTTTGVKEVALNNFSTTISQLKVYPNPFNSQMRISYNLKSKRRVKVKIFDMLGREIESLK
ncbi:MAG: T9SS type A sorting domain-containing protein, partial [Calditrichaeota bacterium]|nr:T9SS type A sorting domain-containing protein [Calditrichota bacterium]